MNWKAIVLHIIIDTFLGIAILSFAWAYLNLDTVLTPSRETVLVKITHTLSNAMSGIIISELDRRVERGLYYLLSNLFGYVLRKLLVSTFNRLYR